MKPYFLLITCFALLFKTGYGQEWAITGVVRNYAKNESIPSVIIGVKNMTVGTVSDTAN